MKYYFKIVLEMVMDSPKLYTKPFKYQINHYLSLLPAGIYPEHFAARVETSFGVKRNDFDRDRFAEMGDSHVIPDERLQIYADLLDVSIEALHAPTTRATGNLDYNVARGN